MANENNNQSMDQQRNGEQRVQNRGQFQKNDPRAVEAGRKGGQASHGGGRRVSE